MRKKIEINYKNMIVSKEGRQLNIAGNEGLVISSDLDARKTWLNGNIEQSQAGNGEK